MNIGWLLMSTSLLLAGALQGNSNNVKGTYALLKPAFKVFSSIHGVVAVETGALQKLYAREDASSKDTVALVKRLFLRMLESGADVVVAKNIRQLDYEEQKTVFFVAIMLALLKSFDQQEAFLFYKKTSETYKQMQAEGKKNLSVDGKTRGIHWLQEQMADYRKELIKYVESSDDFANFAEPFKKVVPYVVKAHLECSLENRKTTFLILLSLLYKETHGDKHFLRTYYNLLNNRLACLSYEPDDAWENDAFKVGDIESLVKTLQAQPLEGDCVQKLFEEYVFVQFSQTVPLATYQDTTFKGQVFADCMNTGVRNIVNVLAYNPELKRFEVSTLEQRLDKKVSENLKHFYELNADPAAVNDKSVHASWAELVSSNVPLVGYNRLIKDGKTEIVPLDKRGFIKTLQHEPAFVNTLIEKGYVLVPEETDIFSVKPSLKNLIVVLENLFSLELFGSDVDKEFVRDDFVATYLPKLATALHATVPTTLDIDSRDFTSDVLTTKFEFNFTQPQAYTSSVILFTKRRHGVVEFCPTPKEATIKFVFPESLKEPYPLSLPLLVHGAEAII